MSVPKKEDKLPTPLVLALASAMVCVGVVAVVISRSGPAETAEERASRVAVNDRTAEAAAESFLDAWRKREHDVARRLSMENALRRVEARRQSDENLSDQERDLQRQVWDAMAATRLQLFLRESRNLPQGRLALAGVAEGEFLEQAYQREVEFVMVETAQGWRVAEVAFGEILSDMPAALRFED